MPFVRSLRRQVTVALFTFTSDEGFRIADAVDDKTGNSLPVNVVIADQPNKGDDGLMQGERFQFAAGRRSLCHLDRM